MTEETKKQRRLNKRKGNISQKKTRDKRDYSEMKVASLKPIPCSETSST